MDYSIFIIALYRAKKLDDDTVIHYIITNPDE